MDRIFLASNSIYNLNIVRKTALTLIRLDGLYKESFLIKHRGFFQGQE
jgi:hypothetical protein